MSFRTDYYLEFSSDNKASIALAEEAVESWINSEESGWMWDNVDYTPPIHLGVFWTGGYFDYYEEELVRISKLYPDVLFQVTDNTYLWRKYVQDGKTQTVYGEVEYPPFDSAKLMPYKKDQ